MILQELGEAGPVREQVAGSCRRGEKLDQQTSARHRLVYPSSSFTFHKEEYASSFPFLLLRHCHTLEWDRGILNRYFSQQQRVHVGCAGCGYKSGMHDIFGLLKCNF